MGPRSGTNVKDAQIENKAIKEGVECVLGTVRNGQRRNEVVKDVQTMLRKEDVYQVTDARRSVH
eukprot:scaffold6643_cov114-Skeletonema_dohrnii-CCMP3373.AAC.9